MLSETCKTSMAWTWKKKERQPKPVKKKQGEESSCMTMCKTSDIFGIVPILHISYDLIFGFFVGNLTPFQKIIIIITTIRP